MLATLTIDSGVVHAQQEWKQEFAEVCGKTHNAMVFSVEELEGFIERSERLRENIRELDETHGTGKKVYGKRLKMCMDLYVFALEQKKAQETENEEK